MLRRGLVLAVFFVSISAFGQIEFQPGFFIDNHDKKTDCLIINNSWKDNNSGFKYKLSDDSDTLEADINQVKRFGIIGSAKYIRTDVLIDRSSEDITQMSNSKEAENFEEKVFLKVLVEGYANLYYFEDGSLYRFFFSIEDSVPSQLVYKKYLDPNGKIETNYGFRQQLWNYVRHSETSMKDLRNLDYDEKEIIAYFRQYNQVETETNSDYNPREEEVSFNLRATAGIVRTSSGDEEFLKFDTQVSYRLGFQVELTLTDRCKWGLLAEPAFQYYKASGVYHDRDYSLDYPMIDFPIGVRHYLFLDDSKKFFLNGFFLPPFSVNFKSKIHYDGATFADVFIFNSWAVGAGFESDRLSAEIRYYTPREIVYSITRIDESKITLLMSRFSFTIAYKLF